MNVKINTFWQHNINISLCVSALWCSAAPAAALDGRRPPQSRIWSCSAAAAAPPAETHRRINTNCSDRSYIKLIFLWVTLSNTRNTCVQVTSSLSRSSLSVGGIPGCFALRSSIKLWVAWSLCCTTITRKKQANRITLTNFRYNNIHDGERENWKSKFHHKSIFNKT